MRIRISMSFWNWIWSWMWQCVGTVVHQVFLSILLEVSVPLTNNMVIFKF